MKGDISNLFLVVHHAKINPAHWQLLLANPGSETLGTTIEVVSSYEGGFEHKITHDCDEADSQTGHSKLHLGLIATSLTSEVEKCALSTDSNGVGCKVLPEEV